MPGWPTRGAQAAAARAPRRLGGAEGVPSRRRWASARWTTKSSIGKLAHVMKKTYLWALVFKSYLVSKLVLNLVVVGLLIRARLAS